MISWRSLRLCESVALITTLLSKMSISKKIIIVNRKISIGLQWLGTNYATYTFQFLKMETEVIADVSV